MNKKKLLKIGFVVLICLAIIGIVTVIGINNHVKNVGGRNIITPEEATEIDDIDCIVVLGCQVKDDGKPYYCAIKDLYTCKEEWKDGN